MEILLIVLICAMFFLLGWRLCYKVNFQNIGSELDSLDAPAESNDTYSIVGESHACGADQSEDSEHTSDETLGKIIDSEKVCSSCSGMGMVWYPLWDDYVPCIDCNDEEKI